MRRGFKADAERIAMEIRGELDLDAGGRLDPFILSEHLAIPILTIGQAARAVNNGSFGKYFSQIDPDSFSAVTIFRGFKRLIVHNESHHPNRQASNVTHEISHTILEHEPTPIISSDGQRYWNPDVEDEANWLGAALLVPREGALQMAKDSCTVEQIAIHFGVSEVLCRWRISQCGVAQQLERWKRWRLNN